MACKEPRKGTVQAARVISSDSQGVGVPNYGIDVIWRKPERMGRSKPVAESAFEEAWRGLARRRPADEPRGRRRKPEPASRRCAAPEAIWRKPWRRAAVDEHLAPFSRWPSKDACQRSARRADPRREKYGQPTR